MTTKQAIEITRAIKSYRIRIAESEMRLAKANAEIAQMKDELEIWAKWEGEQKDLLEAARLTEILRREEIEKYLEFLKGCLAHQERKLEAAHKAQNR
jgi:DNA-binding transcriptional regulator GbsR (MarR family)